MVVAGTDAAATVLPHLARQLIALHSLRADVAAQVETLVQAHPLYQVLTSMPGIGVPAAAVFLAETLGKTSRHRRPPGLLPRPGTGDQEIGLIDPRRACHPRRQQAAHARRVPVRLRLPALRPRQPGLLPAQTRSGKASQPGRPRPGPPPHRDPARHDPGWSSLRSTTISTPTRSRLTHHIGAPPGSRRPPARRARREGDRRRPLRRASDHVRWRGGPWLTPRRRRVSATPSRELRRSTRSVRSAPRTPTRRRLSRELSKDRRGPPGSGRQPRWSWGSDRDGARWRPSRARRQRPVRPGAAAAERDRPRFHRR